MEKRVIKKLILGTMLALLISSPVQAKGFSTSYGGKSSSYTSSRAYTTPRAAYVAPSPVVTKNVTVNKTTVVHSSSGGSSGGGLVTGMVLGHMLSQPSQAPIIVQQPATVVQPQIVEQTPMQPQIVVQKPEETSHWFMWLIVFLLLGFGVYFIANKETK